MDSRAAAIAIALVDLLLVQGCAREPAAGVASPDVAASASAAGTTPGASGGAIAAASWHSLARAAGPDDPPVVRIAEQPLHASELRFWIRYLLRFGLAARSDAALVTGATADADLVERAITLARQERAVESLGAENDVALQPSDTEKLGADRDRQVRIYGSESEYRHIVAAQYGDEAVYEYLRRVELLGKRLFARLHGEHGDECDAECERDYESRFKPRVLERANALPVTRLPALAGIDVAALRAEAAMASGSGGAARQLEVVGDLR